jgi:hypothetical protein
MFNRCFYSPLSNMMVAFASLTRTRLISKEYQKAFYEYFGKESDVKMRDMMIKPAGWNRFGDFGRVSFHLDSLAFCGSFVGAKCNEFILLLAYR